MWPTYLPPAARPPPRPPPRRNKGASRDAPPTAGDDQRQRPFGRHRLPAQPDRAPAHGGARPLRRRGAPAPCPAKSGRQRGGGAAAAAAPPGARGARPPARPGPVGPTRLPGGGLLLPSKAVLPAGTAFDVD